MEGKRHSRLYGRMKMHSSAPVAITPRMPKLAWYWNRLRCMSVPEVGHRVSQALLAQVQRAGFATAREAPPANLDVRARSFIAVDAHFASDPYVAAADRLLAKKFTVFALESSWIDLLEWNRDPKSGRCAPLQFGKTLDYRDADLVGNIKYLWEPNRHLHLVTLAQAYRLTQERRYLDGLRDQIESWLDQCPYLMGPNWTSSLELAIRLINWSVIWQLTDAADSLMFADARGQALRKRWLVSIYQHVHFIRGHLSRYSSANNHLIGELTGIFIAVRTWPFWTEFEAWGRYAKKQLVHEVLAQNAQDGVNREQATAYQQFVLDFMLLAALAGRANGDDFPVQYWHRMERMLEYIAAIMDVGGNVPMIGDADDGYVVRLSPEPDFSPFRSLLATGAVLFSRADFKGKARLLDDKSGWLLGEIGAKKFKELRGAPRVNIRRDFPEGGYYVLGGNFDTDREIRIVVDAGPLGYRRIAAHGHADALAFTLSIGGHEFLIDAGTYSYHTERFWRAYFRGTSAHNTVRVDRQDQSVAGGNFLWIKHARACCVRWEERGGIDRFVGRHEGYKRLADPLVHERSLEFDREASRLTVIDTLTCKGSHFIEQYWHFSEDVRVEVANDGTIQATKANYSLRLQAPAGTRARVYCGSTVPPAGWVSRRFDVKTAACTVAWEREISGLTRLETSIQCTLPPRSAPLDLTKMVVVENVGHES